MKPLNDVSISGYGAYVPVYRIKAEEIARVWGKLHRKLPITEKSVPGPDEDSITMSVEAAKYAIARAKINPQDIKAIYVGSESHPYAVKPSATVIAEAIGMPRDIIAIDMEFACRAGTTAMQSIVALVASGMIKYGIAIGVDTAQGRPGDELEFTAAAGAAAYILGNGKDGIAILEGSTSYVTDTPDFWRREGETYPRHFFRFTGEPAYFHHIINAVNMLMEELGLKPSDFKYAVFHQPNYKFPLSVGKRLGFSIDQLKPGILSNIIGNTYAASSIMGFAAVLDIAKPDDRILVASFGSGAGSDAFSFIVTDLIEERRSLAPSLNELIARKRYVDYAFYAKYRGKIKVN